MGPVARGPGLAPSILVQIGLDPPRRVMDVHRLQAARPEVLESMRNPRGAEQDVAGGGVDGHVPDEEPGPPRDDDEGLVIRMHVIVGAQQHVVDAHVAKMHVYGEGGTAHYRKAEPATVTAARIVGADSPSALLAASIVES